jgi:hypothetical protein
MHCGFVETGQHRQRRPYTFMSRKPVHLPMDDVAATFTVVSWQWSDGWWTVMVEEQEMVNKCS